MSTYSGLASMGVPYRVSALQYRDSLRWGAGKRNRGCFGTMIPRGPRPRCFWPQDPHPRVRSPANILPGVVAQPIVMQAAVTNRRLSDSTVENIIGGSASGTSGGDHLPVDLYAVSQFGRCLRRLGRFSLP